jgi:hypothetical protein
MSFLAGERITAARLNRLQPTEYFIQQTAVLAGATTNVLVPGMTIPFTTLAPNATYTATWFLDFDITTAHTGTSLGRARLDASIVATYADFAGEVVTDRMSPGNQFSGTIALAGAHTLDVVATLQTGCQLNTVSSVLLRVTEVA